MPNLRYRITPQFETYGSKKGDIRQYKIETYRKVWLLWHLEENYYRETMEATENLLKSMRSEGFTLSEIK